MSKDKKGEAWTQSHVINPINLTLRSKVKIVSWSWMYTTHRLMVIHSCAKYDKPMSNQKKSDGPDTKTCQKPYKFDLEVKVQGRIWIFMYGAHHLMVIHPCVKYGKPMWNQKKVIGRTWICTDRLTDGRTDRRTDRVIPNIPPWTSFTEGMKTPKKYYLAVQEDQFANNYCLQQNKKANEA